MQMFLLIEDCTVKPKRWTVLASTAFLVGTVGSLAMVQMIFPEALPHVMSRIALEAPVPPPLAIPPQMVEPGLKPPPKPCGGALCAPKRIPREIPPADEPPPQNTVTQSGKPGGVPGGIPGVDPTGVPVPPPPPAPKSEPEKPKVVVERPKGPVRVGGDVKPPVLIKKVMPLYPQMAKSIRLSGTVRFTGIIGRDGTIQQLQLVSGNPLLVPAATEAVKQWVYTPTTLNGEPVEVITQIDVNFTLSQ